MNVLVPPGTTESRRCWSGSDRQTDVPRYLSEERCLALRLCGWISRGPDIDVEIFLRSLEQEREWERAAAVALFNLDIRRAIQILNKGATSEKGESFSHRGGWEGGGRGRGQEAGVALKCWLEERMIQTKHTVAHVMHENVKHIINCIQTNLGALGLQELFSLLINLQMDFLFYKASGN